MQIVTFDEVAEEWVTRTDMVGGQGTRHLISRALAGTGELVADLARFPPGFVHHLHRHPDGDQIMLPLDGPLVLLHPDGDRDLAPGQIVVLPRGQWHGARNEGQADVTTLVIFSGVGAVAEAGYEEHVT